MLAQIKNLIAIVGFSMTILSPIIGLFLSRENASAFQAWISAAVLLLGLIAITVSGKMTLSKEKKRMKELYSRDYKMYLETNTEDFETIRSLFSISRENEQEEMVKDDYVFEVWKKEYDPQTNQTIQDILSNKNKKSSIKCRRISNETKKGKCFLQCMFVPLDKDNNTLLISRLDENHPSLMSRNLKRFFHSKPKISEYGFISFSPLPDYFSQVFDPSDTYRREVKQPSDSKKYHYDVNFQGLILRKTSLEETEDTAYYLMMVYTVRYPNVSFAEGDSIADLFSCSNQRDISPRGKRFTIKLFDMFNTREKDILYFEKDHDEIHGTATWKEMTQIIADHNENKSMPEIKKAEQRIAYHFAALYATNSHNTATNNSVCNTEES